MLYTQKVSLFDDMEVFMGKFDGYLLCTDIDGTLVADNQTVSMENTQAIEYFKREGGKFTIASGRIWTSMARFFTYARPNLPVVSHNGAVVYDLENRKIVYEKVLPKSAFEVVEYVDQKFGFSGIEIYTADALYFCKQNDRTNQHFDFEKLNYIEKKYQDIREPWQKVIFVQEPEQTLQLKKDLEQSEYYAKYSFVQSAGPFYELLHKNACKGDALLHLASMEGIKPAHIVAIGDNDNDVSMLCTAGISYAVENAHPAPKAAAKYMAPSNNDSAVAYAVEQLERSLTFGI